MRRAQQLSLAARQFWSTLRNQTESGAQLTRHLLVLLLSFVFFLLLSFVLLL